MSSVVVLAKKLESTYPLVVASLLPLGVARSVIVCELRLKLPVGAVILLRVVLFK